MTRQDELKDSHAAVEDVVAYVLLLCGFKMSLATHWMPLPAAPKKGGEV